MPDIEKVKTGIFEMLQRNTWKDIDDERRRFQPVLNDALKLLKEQQPKVLSKEDVTKHDVVWMETNKDEIFPVLVNGATGDPKYERHYYIHLYGVDGYIVGFPVFLYNRTWRCWTNRPTNNVRMNTPWNGGEQE